MYYFLSQFIKTSIRITLTNQRHTVDFDFFCLELFTLLFQGVSFFSKGSYFP
ncbi:hypothetical protein Hanom_Chr04g00307921 [Helianthus anomalus]